MTLPEIAPTPITCVMHERFDWDAPDGRPKPGDMFWSTFSSGGCSTHEPPCERHLMVVCPDGHWWDIDGRASNCTMKDDKQHRCWVRHGELPKISVDKNGLTCSAGAGSILTDRWHGFLRNGELVA